MHGPQMTSIAKRFVILTAFLLLAAITHLNAQTTSGTLLGVVRDKAGRGLSETKITIENEENGNRRATRTDEKGNYTIFNLPPGAYKITAAKDGFREQTIQSFPIQFNQKNVIKLPLFTLLTATLNGKVIDIAGNALPGARIIVVGKRDNVSHETVANQAGFYSFSDLPFDLYQVKASWADRRGELSGVSSIFLTPQTESTQFVGVLFPIRRSELDTLSSRSQVTNTTRPAVIQPAQFRRPALTETGGAITDAIPKDTRPITAPPNNRQPVTVALPIPGQTTQTSYQGAEAAAIVNTTDAARTSNFSERQINSLPVGGATAMRSVDEFALLAPGVAPPPYTPGVRGPGVGFGIGTAGQFSVNGMRARSNNFSMDGSDNNDPDVGMRRQGFVALVPQPIESVKEVSISTLLWDTELGRNFGSQVNAVTKYGGNKYHGQMFALFTDSRLNARNFFDTNGKPPFTRTQAGVTFSGPIFHNRTQFFVSFERDQTRASVTEHFSTPTVQERRFQDGVQYTTNIEFPGHVFRPVAFTDALPLGKQVLSLYPLPNDPNGPYGANTFTTRAPADDDGVILSLKMTHQINLSSSLSGRYNFTDDGRVLPSVNQAIRSTLDSRTRSHNFSLIWDKALGHSISNQARFSFGRTLLNLFEYPNNPFIFSARASQPEMLTATNGVDMTSGVADTGLIGELLIEPFSPVGINAFTFPQRRASNTFQYADSVSWSAGNHSIKFGANMRRYQLNSVLDRLYRPLAVFGYGKLVVNNVNNIDHVISGAQLATLGSPPSVLQTMTLGPPDSTIGLRFTEYHGFVNDNWRIRPNFVLDYGLRYEYNTVPREVNDRIENALQLKTLPPVGPPYPFNDPGLVSQFNQTMDAYRKVLAGRRRIYDPDYNNFAPRFGFAWSVGNSGKTVIRGGYGIYYDAILGAVVSQSRNVFPNETQFHTQFKGLSKPFDFTNPTNLLAFGLAFPGVFLLAQTPCNQFGTCNQFGLAPQGFAAAIGWLSEQPTNQLEFTLPEKKLHSPYAQQWHLTAEREVLKGYLLSIAYVGSKGTKLTRLTTPNNGRDAIPVMNINTTSPPRVSVSQFSTPLRPKSGLLGAYQIFENSASSVYHALQIEARKRYSQNYQFTAAYTWSHAIDDVSDLFPIAGAPVIAQDSRNFRAERGDANFDIRHRFAASFLWDLPFYGNSSSSAGRIFKNWQIASTFQMNTGQPFTLNLPIDANEDGNLTDRPSTTNGLIFLNGHGPQRIVLAPGKQLTDFFTFTLKKDGAVGRNTARGDNFIDLDLSVSRTFKFGETKNLTLRAEFFNFLNRANFGLPVRIMDAPGFGSAVDTVNPGRTIVFVLKSRF